MTLTTNQNTGAACIEKIECYRYVTGVNVMYGLPLQKEQMGTRCNNQSLAYTNPKTTVKGSIGRLLSYTKR